MFRYSLIGLFLIGIILPTTYTNQHHRIKHYKRIKTVFKNLNVHQSSQNDQTMITIPSLVEIDHDLWQATSPHIHHTKKNGEQWDTVAKHGLINENTNTIELIDDVRSKSNSKTLSKLLTDHLIIDQKRNLYISKGKTIAKTNNQTFTGDGLEYNQAKGKIVLPHSGKLVYNR